MARAAAAPENSTRAISAQFQLIQAAVIANLQYNKTVFLNTTSHIQRAIRKGSDFQLPPPHHQQYRMTGLAVLAQDLK